MSPLEVGERVVSTRVSFKFAGWLPQVETFESERTAGLEIERNQLHCNVIAHKSSAGHSQTLAAITELISSGQLWVVSRRARPATSTSRPVRGRSPR